MSTLKEIKAEMKALRLTVNRQKAGLMSWKTRRHESTDEAEWRKYSYGIFDKINSDLDKIIKKLEGIVG
jgi:hypothetical protein